MTQVFRAAHSNRLGPDAGHFCCSEDLEVARSYHGDGGYGGPRLYRFDLDCEIVDITIDGIVEVCRAAGCDADYLASLERQEWVYQALDNLGAWEILAEAGIVAVRYVDEFPVDAVTIAYFGDVLRGEEIV